MAQDFFQEFYSILIEQESQKKYTYCSTLGQVWLQEPINCQSITYDPNTFQSIMMEYFIRFRHRACSSVYEQCFDCSKGRCESETDYTKKIEEVLE